MCAQLRVLVVDDDEVIASTTSLILNASGFESVAAFSGEQALVFAHSEPFHLLLTDVVMEPMNGIELAFAFLAIQPAAKVLLITGTPAAAQLVLDALQRGRDFLVLQKPVHPRDLIEQLHTVSVLDAPR